MPPNEMILEALFTLILPPFVLAAVTLGLVHWWGGAKQGPGGAASGLILAVVLGPTLGHWLHDSGENRFELWLRTTLTLMPGDSSWNRLPWSALAALCLGRLTSSAETPTTDAWLVRGAASFAIAWWVLPAHAHALGVWAAPAFGAAILFNWMLLESLACKPIDGSVALCILLSFLVASLVLLQAGTARLSESAIVLGSAFAGLAVIAALRGADTSGAVPASSVMLPGLLLLGNRETSVETVPMLAYLLAALAPLTLVIALPFAHWQWAWRLALRLVLIAIPLALAVLLALQAGPMEFE